MPLSTPTRFGRYVVLDLLTGDPGEITLLAYDPQLDRKVGLKVFDLSFEGDGESRRRDKARALANLVHPHVVRVHDVGSHEGRLFVAMDFVEGVTFDVWLARERPAPRRIVEVLLAAAEGLAAAHAAGLVHGAFSPKTLVLGDDGQIRVLDFVRSAPAGARPLSDATTDRVDLCATLYEALFQTSPWGDDGQVKSPPRETKVPFAVRRVVTQGLRRDEAHPTMRELAASLRRGLRARRLVWGAAAAAVLVAASAGAVATAPRSLPKGSWCEGVDARIGAVWNPDVAARAHAAFVSTRVPFAEPAWASVERDVEGFVADWRAAERRDCARGAAAVARPAVAVCLHRQYESLRAFASALQEADAELVAHSTKTAAALGDPSACDAELGDPIELGDAELSEVLAIQSDLSAAEVQRELSQYARSITSAERANAAARTAGIKSLVAEAEYQLARTHALTGEEDAAERGYHESFAAAVASRHAEFIARSSMELAQLLAEQGRHDEAKRWIEHARAAVHTHDTPALRIRLAAVEGAAAFRRGDYEQARDHFRHSGELVDATERPDAFAKMHANKMLANAIGRLGDTPTEIQMLEDGLEFAEDKLGREHPNVAHYLNSLASAYSRRGAVDEALAANVRAVAIFERVFGPVHSNTAMGLANMAGTLHEAGRDEEAEAAYVRALKIARDNLPTDDSRRITIVGNAGMFYALQGEYVQAAALLADAAARSEAINGPDHSFTLGFLTNLAATHMFAGEPEKARDVYRELLGRTERVLGPEHPQVTPCLLGLATVESTLGQPEVAVPLLRRALKIAIDRGDRPERLAVVQFKLAQALWDAGAEREEARMVARSARQSYVAAADGGWEVDDSLSELDRWLAEHG